MISDFYGMSVIVVREQRVRALYANVRTCACMRILILIIDLISVSIIIYIYNKTIFGVFMTGPRLFHKLHIITNYLRK